MWVTVGAVLELFSVSKCPLLTQAAIKRVTADFRVGPTGDMYGSVAHRSDVTGAAHSVNRRPSAHFAATMAFPVHKRYHPAEGLC